MAVKPEVMERLLVPAASSIHPALGVAYSRAGYGIGHPSNLVRTDRNYYDSRPAEDRMSTAAEELAMQLLFERAGKDPRKEAAVFNDLFGRNDSHWYAWQWTETGLRVPKGRDPNKYETNTHGRKYWVREFLIGNEAVGEILVPEGRGRVAVEWDEVSGLPRVTDEIKFPHIPYTTHFWFNAKPNKDNTSSHYDIAVGRRSYRLRGEDGRCLVVAASYARSYANSDGGFRPVRGSLPDITRPDAPQRLEKIVYL